MAPRKRILAAWLILAGLPVAARAQGLPGLPGLGGAGGAAGAGGLGGAAGGMAGAPAAMAPGALAAAPRTIWGALGLSKSNLAACKQQLCASQLGQMLNSGLTPLSALTGGMIPTCCPTVPSAAQVAALAAAGGPAGAEAVAAQIKMDEADAKARRAAVRYLSTADCHYWPEAEAAIIGSLRDDRNECVRYEAALALLNGCCCTAKTIEALKIVVAGSEKDGKPSETSERVRGVATSALQGCLVRYQPPPEPVPLERPEPASATRPSGDLSPTLRRVAYYYVALRDVPPALIVADARRTLQLTARNAQGAQTAMLLTGKRSVYDALARAAATPPPPTRPAPARPATVPPPPPLRLSTEGDAETPTRGGFPAPAVAVERAAVSPPPVVPTTPSSVVPTTPPARPRPDGLAPKATASKPAGRGNLRDILLDSARVSVRR